MSSTEQNKVDISDKAEKTRENTPKSMDSSRKYISFSSEHSVSISENCNEERSVVKSSKNEINSNYSSSGSCDDESSKAQNGCTSCKSEQVVVSESQCSSFSASDENEDSKRKSKKNVLAFTATKPKKVVVGELDESKRQVDDGGADEESDVVIPEKDNSSSSATLSSYGTKSRVTSSKIRNKCVVSPDNASEADDTSSDLVLAEEVDRNINEEDTEDETDSFIIPNTYTPPVIQFTSSDTELYSYRIQNLVIAEGFMYKRRPICCCLWHKQYVVLLKTGMLVCHEVDGVNKETNRHNLLNQGVEKGYCQDGQYKNRLVLSKGMYFGFEEERDRNYWYTKIVDFKQQFSNIIDNEE